MNSQEKQQLQQMAQAIRILSMDAIQASNSGHPGLPLGCAEIGAYLFGKGLRHNPANPQWQGRDRFILSAGHGSMLLYSCLHLSGYDLPIEELKRFRQMESKTPGHPEYGWTEGVETTTGPLGQGFANAAGMALANKMMAARFGVEQAGLLDSKFFVLCGDGCMMEGITAETASLAGHLKLDNLVVIYDSNSICLDGPTSECFGDDTMERYRAYGWHVTEVDGHNLDQIEAAVEAARVRKGQPSLIIARTVIGKGSPNMAGSHKAHGAPLGAEEIRLTKEALGASPEPFVIDGDVYDYTRSRLEDLAALEADWNRRFEQWAGANPQKAAEWKAFLTKTLPADFDAQVRAIPVEANAASRKSSNVVLQSLCNLVPFLVGGSADLSCSDLTAMKAGGVVSAANYNGRNVKFGVREFAMGAMNTGMAQQGMVLPFCGTFLTFSDYMRNAIRMASLMEVKVVYQFTHDSFHVGEDGPTHQPIEQVASLRLIPGLTVIRPADVHEVKGAWSYAIEKAKGPVALCLSRQNLPDLEAANRPTSEGVGRGGYVVLKESGAKVDYLLIATGSEVSLALEVAKALVAKGKSVRVVSMPSCEIFDQQDKAYQDSVLGGDIQERWALEAGVGSGWYKYIGREGQTVCMHSFGTSAPSKEVAKKFGFTTEAILKRMGY